jgi:hypothetical protein
MAMQDVIFVTTKMGYRVFVIWIFFLLLNPYLQS